LNGITRRCAVSSNTIAEGSKRVTIDSEFCLSRRLVLQGSAALAFTTSFPTWSARAEARREFRLAATPGRAPLVGENYPQTSVWAYDGKVPGPTLHFCQGEPVRIVVENRLDEDTTVHWHGIRLPNTMDGVPGLTQPPIYAVTKDGAAPTVYAE
jgi:FtsP/CotA-like multicopper oxidase with cupredoxin domain